MDMYVKYIYSNKPVKKPQHNTENTVAFIKRFIHVYHSHHTTLKLKPELAESEGGRASSSFCFAVFVKPLYTTNKPI